MSITRTKERLAEAILIQEHLSLELKNSKPAATFGDDEWANYLRVLGHDTAKLIQASRALDDKLIEALLRKQKRLEKHREWKKRAKKKTRQRLFLTEKRSKQWIKDMEWKVATARSTEKPENKEEKKKIKELTRLLDRLTRLRNLRRKKLESKGHFFAEDGNDFFNKIKEWHEQQEESNPEPSKELVIDKQDEWKENEIDKEAYAFWCESNQSIDALLRIRKQWDKYIIKGDERDVNGKIPPTYVTPAPPANWVWATCLL